MIRPEYKQTLADQQGPVVIIWSFFTISVPIYLVIAKVAVPEAGFMVAPSMAQIIPTVLWLLVLVDLGYLVWWKNRNLNRAALMERPKKTQILRALEEHRGDDEERAAIVVSTYVTRKIVVFAIVEAIAVYGFILALIGRLSDMYLLSALSLALLAIEFPRKGFLHKLIKEVEEARSCQT